MILLTQEEKNFCDTMDILKLLHKQKVFFDTPIDSVVLACTIYRLAQEGWSEYYSLDTIGLLEKVRDPDYELAEKIRKHYGEVLIIEKLKGKTLSSFRTDLAEVLSGDGSRIDDKCRGLVVMLPHFYMYDRKIQELKETIFTHEPTANQIGVTLSLKPVTRMYRNVRNIRRKKYIYWFKVDSTGMGAKIEIEKGNVLLPLWDKFFSNDQTLAVRGDYKISSDGLLTSYHVHNFTIENFNVDN